MAFQRIIELQISPPGDVALRVTGLKVEFECLKTNQQSSAVSKIKVFNMKEDVAKHYGKNANKTPNRVYLNVGYADESPRLLIAGDLYRSLYVRDGLNTIWQIEVYDGQAIIQNTKATLSYGKGTPVTTVVNALVGLLGIPLGNPLPSISQQYAGGFSYQGLAWKCLTQVLAYVGLRCSMQNNQIYILGKNENLIDSTIILSKDTGLLYAPEPLEDQAKYIGVVPTRYKLRALINPLAVPGTKIQLQSAIANGKFIIESARFNGDNWDGDFMMSLEVKAG